MDEHAQRLVRLADLMKISAAVVRDLKRIRDFDSEADNLTRMANDLERLSAVAKRIGLSGLPR